MLLLCLFSFLHSFWHSSTKHQLGLPHIEASLPSSSSHPRAVRAAVRCGYLHVHCISSATFFWSPQPALLSLPAVLCVWSSLYDLGVCTGNKPHHPAAVSFSRSFMTVLKSMVCCLRFLWVSSVKTVCCLHPAFAIFVMNSLYLQRPFLLVPLQPGTLGCVGG